MPRRQTLRAALAVAVTSAALVVPVALAAPASAASAPTVTAVSPTSGSVNGGTAVTVTGTGFTGATSVSFGAAPAAAFKVVSATSLTATAPAGNLGPVDIRVTTRSGTSAVVTADRHTYVGSYRLTGTTAVGSGAAGVGVDTATNTAYVSDSADDTVSVVDLATNRVVDEIYVPPAGGGSGRAAGPATEPGLGAIAVDSSTHTVYVLETDSSEVVILDGTTRTVVDRLPVGTAPGALAVDPTTHRVWVTSEPDGTVTLLEQGAVIDTIALDDGAGAVAVDPTRGTAYVTSASTDTLTVIDGPSRAVTATVRVGGDPHGVAVDPAARKVYVANSADGTVSVVVNAAVAATFAVPDADRLAFDPRSRTLYLAAATGPVRVVDPTKRTVTATVTVPDGVGALAIDPVRHALAVVGDAADTVSLIQAGNPPLVGSLSPRTGSVSGGRTVTITGTGFTGARGVLFGTVPATSFTVVSATAIRAVVPVGVPGTVDVRVLGKKETSPATAAARWTWTGSYRTAATVEVSTTPVAVAVDPAAGLAYVVNSDNDSVSILDSRTGAFVRRVSTGFTPSAVAVDPTTHLAIASSLQGISVFQSTTPVTDEPEDVGAIPTAVAVDPTTHRFYLVTPGSNQVAVYDGTTRTVTARIGVGTNPVAVAVNPTTHRVYVANAGSKDMTVVDGTTNTVLRTKEFGVAPTAVAVDPTTDTVYTAVGAIDRIGLTNGTTGFDEVALTVGDNPSGIAVDPTNHTVFVTNAAADSVSVVDGTTRTVVATVPVGATPSAVAVDTVGHRAVVANKGAATASFIAAADVPTVTAVSPDEGPFEGGRTVTITGTDLTGASAVDFGEFPAASFTVVSPTQITAVSPVGNLGAQVHVTVTTPFGTSTPTAADTFTFGKATPTLTTSPSPGVKVTGALSTSVQAVDGSDPGGNVTFDLYGPGAPTCTGAPVSRIFASLTDGAASSTRNTVTVAGTYHWVVSYDGDNANEPVSTGCVDATVVTPGNLDHLVVTPGTATVAPGARQTYVVTGFDRFDNRRGDVTASSVLTIAGGTCTGASCSATTAGPHTVTATSGGKTATAVLTIASPARRG